jgi:hypothetical protein
VTILDHPVPAQLIPAPAQPVGPLRPSSVSPTVRRPRIRPVRYEPDPSPFARPATQPALPAAPVTADLPCEPEARSAAQRLLRIVIDILNKRRPLIQLKDIADPSVIRCVRVAIPDHDIVQTRSLHITQPRAGAGEVTAVCRVGTRYRAIALRLDHRPVGWRCTALRLL